MAKGMSFEKEDRIWEITGYTDCAYTSPKHWNELRCPYDRQ